MNLLGPLGIYVIPLMTESVGGLPMRAVIRAGADRVSFVEVQDRDGEWSKSPNINNRIRAERELGLRNDG